jgi:hypothetical protein
VLEEADMGESTENTMDTTTASSADSGFESEEEHARKLEEAAALHNPVWKYIRNYMPANGALIGGAVGIGAATVFGVGELAVGAFCAYVTYRVFGYGETWADAVENTIRFEKGELSKEELKKPVL